MIYGILSISNGVALNYPIPPVMLSLSGFADRCIIGVDPNFPEDRKLVEGMGLPNVECVDSVWVREIDNGYQIAAQMDHLVNIAGEQGADWVAVMQADELLHQKDFSMLRRFIASTESMDGPGPHYPDVVGFSFLRLYFWGSLNKIRQDWNARLIRLFKPGYFSFLADNTDKSGMYSGQIKPGKVLDLTYNIYHYSRLGAPDEISRRVRNLDSFYHAEETLVPVEELPAYDFEDYREYDNWNIISPPPKKDNPVIVDYNGTHPKGVEEWFTVEK